MTSSLPVIKNRLNGRFHTRFGLTVTVLGFIIFLVGAEPDLFGLDRSPVIGFVQISVFLVGLGFISLGGYISLAAFWKGGPKSIIADVGQRLVATGYMIAVGSGMADLFGFGSQQLPLLPRFGEWQAIGVLVGQLVIAIGFLMLIPYKTNSPQKTEPLILESD